MLVFQDAMKKPEPPKEFDEELVLAKVGRNSYDEYLKLRLNLIFGFKYTQSIIKQHI